MYNTSYLLWYNILKYMYHSTPIGFNQSQLVHDDFVSGTTRGRCFVSTATSGERCFVSATTVPGDEYELRVCLASDRDIDSTVSLGKLPVFHSTAGDETVGPGAQPECFSFPHPATRISLEFKAADAGRKNGAGGLNNGL